MFKDSTSKPIQFLCFMDWRQNIAFVIISLELHFHCAWLICIQTKEIIFKRGFLCFCFGPLGVTVARRDQAIFITWISHTVFMSPFTFSSSPPTSNSSAATFGVFVTSCLDYLQQAPVWFPLIILYPATVFHQKQSDYKTFLL